MTDRFGGITAKEASENMASFGRAMRDLEKGQRVTFYIDEASSFSWWDSMPGDMIKSDHNHKRNNLAMKHKITVLTCIVLLIIVAVIVAKIHQDRKVEAAQQAAIAASISVQKQQTLAAQEAITQTEIKTNEAQCAKDKAAYNALLPTQKVKSPAPVCFVQVVQ